MAGGGVQFLIDLQARFAQLTPARKALVDLEKQIKSNREALASLESKLLKATPKQAGELLKQVDASRKSLGALQASVPAWKAFAAASERSTIDVEAFSNGMMAASKAAMAVIAVIAAAAAGFVAYAIYAADAARSTMLLNIASAGSVEKGTELNAVVSQLARRIPIARAKLDEMATSLIDAKLAGRDMQNALTAIATVASARGQQAASAIDAIAKSSASMRRFMLGARDVRGEFASLAGTGIKAKDIYNAVAKTLGITVAQAQQRVLAGTISLKKGMEILATVAQDKFGATIAGQMLSLTTQIDKVKENFGLLFSGIKLDKFLKGLDSVTSLLSQDTFTGYALKTVLTGAMNGFLDAAGAAMPYVRAMLIGIAIGALVLFLAFLKVKKAISDAFKGTDTAKFLSDLNYVKGAMYAGIIAVAALTSVFILLAAAMFIALVPLALLAIALLVLVAIPVIIAYAFYKGFKKIESTVTDALNALAGIDLTAIGQKAIESLIGGLSSMKGSLASTVADIAALIPGGISTALVMHSPSVLLTNQGRQAIGSFSSGAEKEADGVEAAGRRAGGALSAGVGAAGGPSGGRGGVVHMTNNFYVDDSGLIARVRETIFDTFEQAGFAVEGPAT